MILRQERAEDAAAIRALLLEAFGGPQEADLVGALEAGGHTVLSLVALDGSETIGHVLFSRLVSPASSLALAPVAVTPARQGKGVGSRLICFGLEVMRESGWASVFVLGDPAYYGRFGFRAELAAAFETDYSREHFMALELTPGALAGLAGDVIYPPPFQALG